MTDDSTIVGLFYSNENNLVFEKVKISDRLPEEAKQEIKMLPFKYFGPIFLTTATATEINWKIELIESSLSLQKVSIKEKTDIIQSFFNLNSTIETEHGATNLFTLIGSPHTEDIKDIYDKMVKYIHPSIIQGKIINESFQGQDFNLDKFLHEELERGMNLIDFSLGSARKMYWEEQQKYYCVGIIERKYNLKDDTKTTYLYTFKEQEELRKVILPYIPSYYVLSILPDYYEEQIRSTLILFGKKGIFPNIRQIKLSSQKNGTITNGKNQLIYLEEYKEENQIKTSYGVILIPESEKVGDGERISYYRKQLRLILDSNKLIEDQMKKINPFLSEKKWSTRTNQDLESIKQILDQS